MKTHLLTLLTLCLTLPSFAQDLIQYFEAGNYYGTPIQIDIDADTNNVWQIGSPQKTRFDSAATLPNAIVTDTINPYPVNNESMFQFNLVLGPWSYGIYAIQWKQKLDMDHGKDWAIVEFKTDRDSTWQNAFDNPYVYNFYGFDTLNVDTMPNGDMAFTGTDPSWSDIWFCFTNSYIEYGGGSLSTRYRFVSDSVDNGKDGWMIDNIIARETIRHTVAEVEQTEYLKVYPTTTNGRVHIEAKKLKEYHIIEKLEVYTMGGERVQYFENVPTKFFIDLDDQAAGTYIIKIQTNKKSETHKVLLQR